MKTILIELGQFFRKEKFYVILLTAVLLFYGALFVTHKTGERKELVNQSMQKMESLLREASQKSELIQERLTSRPILWWLVQLFTFIFVAAVGFGIWLIASDIGRWVHTREFLPSSGSSLLISWGIGEVFKVIILFFACGIVLNLFLGWIKPVYSPGGSPSLLILTHTVLLDAMVTLFIMAMIRQSGSQLKDLLGFQMAQFPFREIWMGIRSYFAILPIFIGILAVLVYVANFFAYEPPPHPLAEVLLEHETLSVWMVAFSLFVACVVGPIVEEIFFRGFFYPALRKYLGRGWAALITAVLFAGVHENMFSFFPIFFLGVVLCYLYEQRSNLVSCISLHMFHNTAFIAYFFLMKSVLFGGGGT